MYKIMGRIIKELLLGRGYRIFSCTLRKKDCRVEDKHRAGFEPAYIRSAGGRVATLPPMRRIMFSPWIVNRFDQIYQKRVLLPL